MNTYELFEEALAEVPEDISLNADWSYDISDRIDALMREKGITKSELARALGKPKSEETKWLGGTQNFTLKTLAAISAYFGVPLISVNKG